MTSGHGTPCAEADGWGSGRILGEKVLEKIGGADATGKVIIGNGGAEYGVRGYVSAYDAETGALAWRFFTVPGDPALGFENETMARAGLRVIGLAETREWQAATGIGNLTFVALTGLMAIAWLWWHLFGRQREGE